MMLVATLAIFARVAGAEMRLDVNEELQRAEEFRKDQEQRRQQASVSQMKILIDPDQDLRLIERGTRPALYIPDARSRMPSSA